MKILFAKGSAKGYQRMRLRKPGQDKEHVGGTHLS